MTESKNEIKTEEKKEDALCHEKVISYLVTFAILAGWVLLFYKAWGWNFSQSQKMACLGFGFTLFMTSLIFRFPDVPKNNASIVWVTFLGFTTTIFFYSWPNVSLFLKENHKEIGSLFKKTDLEVLGVLKLTSEFQTIQKNASESQKIVDASKEELQRLKKYSVFFKAHLEALADQREGLDKLKELAEDNDKELSHLAAVYRENILRNEEHIHSLSSEKTVLEYFTNIPLASVTTDILKDTFLKKIHFRDEVWEFFDALRKDNSIPELEKRRFYFQYIKEPSIGKSVVGLHWARELLVSTNGSILTKRLLPISSILSFESFDSWWNAYKDRFDK